MSEKIIHLNEAAIKSESKELVRSSVEETPNDLLDQEALAQNKQQPIPDSGARFFSQSLAVRIIQLPHLCHLVLRKPGVFAPCLPSE